MTLPTTPLPNADTLGGTPEQPQLTDHQLIAAEDLRWYNADPPGTWFRKPAIDYGAAAHGTDPFSRELVPAIIHPLVMAAGEPPVQALLRASLLRFARFTVDLEMDEGARRTARRDRVDLAVQGRDGRIRSKDSDGNEGPTLDTEH